MPLVSRPSRDVVLPTGVVVPGWIRLPEVDPEDLEGLTLRVLKENVLTYQCPTCGNQERSDIAGLEPCCTGPTWRDEHPMEVMELTEC